MQAKPASKSRSRSFKGRRQLVRLAERMLFVVAAIGTVWFLCATSIEFIKNNAAPTPAGTVRMTVAPGDTLWTIAETLTADGQQRSDRMNEIRLLNPNISSSQALTAGQTLIVPAASAGMNSDLHLARAITADPHSM